MGRHAAADPLPISGWEWDAEVREFLPERVLVVQDAPAHRLGRMCGQHRDDLELLQRRSHLLGRDSARGASSQHSVQLTGLVADLGGCPRLPLQLRKVDQLEVGREGAHEAGGVWQFDPVQLFDQAGFIGSGILLAERLGAQPNRLLQLVQRLALVLAEDLSQEPSQQADLGPQAGLGKHGSGRPEAHGEWFNSMRRGASESAQLPPVADLSSALRISAREMMPQSIPSATTGRGCIARFTILAAASMSGASGAIVSTRRRMTCSTRI